MDDFKRWTIKRQDTEYENPWIRVVHSDVIAPTGADGIYGTVHFKNLAIGIFPIDEDGSTWIVGQTRFVFDAYSWELPQGGGPRGEPPVDTAQRELSEECNLAAAYFIPLFENLQVSNCITDELGHAFIAHGLSARSGTPDETEELTVRRIPVRHLMEMIEADEIRDMFTVMMVARACQLAAMGKLPEDIARHFRF